MAPPRKRTKLSTDQPAEILFDVTARQDYLTGFHKRKVARKEHAKETAIKRAKEEKVQERRQMREQRKVDLQKHVEEVNRELRKMNPDLSSEDEDETEVSVVPVTTPFEQDEEEYVDEDKYTTVTVEAMGDEDSGGDESTEPRAGSDVKQSATKSTTAKHKSERPVKRKKKKFRYESKLERKETRLKQKAKNRKAAEARKEK